MKTKDKMKKAIKLLKNDGLFECSSERQKTNGTLYFVDPKTMTGYSITKSGYCRRHTFNISNYGYRINHYQLNKTIQEKKNDRYGSYWTTIGRILEPGKYVKLAKQLLGPIEHWRKNN